MLDYNKVQELFGAPLNTVPTPQTPFKIKPWHFVVGGIVGYVIYRGVKEINKDYQKRFGPKVMKKED